MTTAEIGWEAYLRSRFPGYLLPQSAVARLNADEAARFLESLTGRADQLATLRAVSVLAPRVKALKTFVLEALGQLVRVLPSRTHTERREWRGGFHGRVLVPATLALHLRGERTSFVTSARRRTFDLPENILLRAVCARLLEVLTHLRTAGALPETGWGEGSRECEGALRRALASTALREVPEAPLGAVDEGAALSARHEAYREAASWARYLREGLDEDDPAQIARVVAEGALLPFDEAARFELAVAIRLAEALGAALASAEPARWRVEYALIMSGRREVVAFARDGATRVRIYYNKAVLEGGEADKGALHYFGNEGRLRPDVTVVFGDEAAPQDALVVECKHSSNPSYLVGGYHEALLYRNEYSRHFKAAPKAALVTSGKVVGRPRAGDEVTVHTWADWPPTEFVEALVRRAR